MSLSHPPTDARELRDFPRADPPIGPGQPPLFRILLHRDPQTGRVRGPFHFASSAVPDAASGEHAATGGRYDLPKPDGACYLALSAIGAWLEVFRSTIVATDDVRRRRLLITRPPYRVRTADLSAAAARGFDITGGIHVRDDYALTRTWARRLHEAGFRALLGKVRHDPRLQERSLTLLDRAGEHEPYGWRWRREIDPLLEADALLSQARAYGFSIVDPPYDVAIDTPKM